MGRHIMSALLVCVVVAVALCGLFSLMGNREREESSRTEDAEKISVLEGESSESKEKGGWKSSQELLEREGETSLVTAVSVAPGDGETNRQEADQPPMDGSEGFPRSQKTQNGFPSEQPEDAQDSAVPPDFQENRTSEKPDSLAAQIDSFVEQSKRTAGPRSVELGERLFSSEDPLLRVAGMAVLGEQEALTSEELEAVASDDDLSVALNSLAWLRDHGYQEPTEELSSLLAERDLDSDDLVDTLYEGQLDASGSRAALDMLAEEMDAEQRTALYQDVSRDQARDYSVRMKAALRLREDMEFEEYRNEVNRIRSRATDDDSLWQEGISRLSESLKGPAEVVGGTPTLTGDDVDELLAREYPMMLEDLAQQLEYVTSREDAYISTEAVEALDQRLQELQDRPWDANQKVRLERIESIAKILPDFADPPEDTPPNMATPPQ